MLKTNWGRWSTDDQLGTLNLVTPERVLGAIDLVRDGQVLSLAHVLRHGMLHHEDRLPPMHVLTVDGGDYAAGVAHVTEGAPRRAMVRVLQTTISLCRWLREPIWTD